MKGDDSKEKLRLLEAYKAAFWPEPYYAHVLVTLAESYAALSSFEEAARLLALAIEIHPDDALAHSAIGRVYWQTNRLEDAVEEFAEADHLDSEGRLDAWQNAEEIILGPLRGPRAVAVLRRVVANYPADQIFRYELARAEGDLAESERLYRGLLAQDLPTDHWRADIEFELSCVLRKKGDITGAAALVEQALPRHSGWSDQRLDDILANDYLELGRFEEALKIYLGWLGEAAPLVGVGVHGRKDLPLPPWDARVYSMVKARLLKLLGFVEEQRNSGGNPLAGRTSAGTPDFFGRVHLALSRCYEASGRPAAAKREYRRAMEYFGDSERGPDQGSSNV